MCFIIALLLLKDCLQKQFQRFKTYSYTKQSHRFTVKEKFILKSAASKMVNIQNTKFHVISEVAKHIRGEIKNLCALTHNSILRDEHEGLKTFNWDSVWAEFQYNVPMLLKLILFFSLSRQYKTSTL